MAGKSKKIDFDPYKVLQIEPGCEAGQIDKAYKKQALKWHPDKNPDEMKKKAEEMFLKVYQAYEFLKDISAKTEYDEAVAAKKRRAEFDEAKQAASSAQRKAHLAKLHEAETRAATAGTKRKMEKSVHDQLIDELRREGAKMMQRMKEEQEERERKARMAEQAQERRHPQHRTPQHSAATQQLRDEVDELEKALFGGTVV